MFLNLIHKKTFLIFLFLAFSYYVILYSTLPLISFEIFLMTSQVNSAIEGC